MPAPVNCVHLAREEGLTSLTAVIIGVDPHKGSHTAVAIDRTEKRLGRLRVPAADDQAARLLTWAAQWPGRTWAVEGAGGLGHLLAQQLVAAGEKVLDVQPKLGSRVRLLSTGSSNKNDPNDAFSVAVAGLRSPRCRPVQAEDDTTVLKLWAKRYQDLSHLRNQAACRLHALLCGLVPGGLAAEITTAQATALLKTVTARTPAARARHQLAALLIADLYHVELQLRDTRAELADAVKACGTSLTGIYGIGPVIAATVIGDAGDITRFANRDAFASYDGTAPIEVSSGSRVVHRLSQRGNRRLNHAIHMVAVTQIRHQGTDGRRYYDKKISEGKTPKEALRALKRRISNSTCAALWRDARRAAATTRPAAGPGGQAGNDSASSAAGSHPENQLFGLATPEPSPQPTASEPAQAPPAGNDQPATPRPPAPDGRGPSPRQPAAKESLTVADQRTGPAPPPPAVQTSPWLARKFASQTPEPSRSTMTPHQPCRRHSRRAQREQDPHEST
jgi:transposase